MSCGNALQHSRESSDASKCCESLCSVRMCAVGLSGGCCVQTPLLLSNPCQQYETVDTPIINPQWTCGLRSSGNFTCPAGKCM